MFLPLFSVKGFLPFAVWVPVSPCVSMLCEGILLSLKSYLYANMMRMRDGDDEKLWWDSCLFTLMSNLSWFVNGDCNDYFLELEKIQNGFEKETDGGE